MKMLGKEEKWIIMPKKKKKERKIRQINKRVNYEIKKEKKKLKEGKK